MIYISLDRVDVQFVAKLLASALSAPTQGDMRRLRRCAKYLAGTEHYVILFPYQGRVQWLVGHCDSDWAGDKVSRKSTSSGVVFHGKHPLESYSCNQQVIALSSGESEFYAAGKGAAHLLYLVHLMKEIGYMLRGVPLTDSTACRGILGRTGPGKIRHMHTRFMWV